MIATLGHYKIHSLLGAGGMGEVYLASDTRLNRKVAIKRLPPSTEGDEEAQRRMLREARMVATIEHPNVCTIYEIGEEGGRPYIVMQYVEGETLADRLGREKISAAEMIDLARQVTSALGEAHNRGIVHRDIKTFNIMINTAGLVKVLDFGLAKSFREVKDVTEILVSTPGLVVGTTLYMSPEQLRGEPLDGRSDIFSLGIVLYEMATGRRPFDRPTAGETITAILTQAPAPITDPDFMPLEPLIVRALAKSPARRFRDATALLQALDKIRIGRGRTARVTQKLKAVDSQSRRKPQIHSLALLPLISSATDGDLDYLRDGLVERMIDVLSLVSGLRVIATSTVMRYREHQTDQQRIAEQLRVDALVTGRIEASEKSMSLRLEMFEAKTQRVIWSGEFERDGQDIEGLANVASTQIADTIRERSSGTGKRRAKRRVPTANPEAEQLYLRGRFQWNKRHPEALRQAIRFFQEAVERDPAYASAYAGMADAFLMLGFLQALPPREIIPRAKASALRAIELDPLLAEPHASLGYLSGVFEWNWPTAQRELREAMRLNPNYPWAPHWLGVLGVAHGRFDESMENIQRARDLDPLSPIINVASGIPLHFVRRYDEAVQSYLRVLEVETAFAPAHYYLGLSYEQMGRYGDAISNFERAREIAGRGSLFVGALGHCYGLSGRGDEARAVIRELEERSKEHYVSAYNQMLIHLGLGEVDPTLVWLERALEERNAWLHFAPVDPRFDRLRGDERFRKMLIRHGLTPEASSR